MDLNIPVTVSERAFARAICATSIEWVRRVR